MKQFYVSVSRGRDAAHIYTDDKAALLEYASQLGDRQSAIELVGKDRTNEAANILNRERMNQNRKHEQEKNPVQKPEQVKQKSYEREPEI